MNLTKPIILVTASAVLLLAASVTTAQTDPAPTEPTTAPAPDTVDPLTGEAPDTTSIEEGEAADEVVPPDGDAPIVEPDAGVAPTTEPTSVPPDTLVPSDFGAEREEPGDDTEVVEASEGFCIPTSHPDTLQPPTALTLVQTLGAFAGDLTVRWEPSPDQEAAGGAVAYYRVEYQVADGDWVELDPQVLREVRRATLEAAEMGQSYNFRVFAVSFELGGERLESEPLTEGPFAVPGLPTEIGPASNLSLVHESEDLGGSITVEWERSSDDGQGSVAVRGYRVSARTAGASEWTVVGDVSAAVTRFPFVEAELGTDYEFQVVAHSATQGETTLESEPLVGGPFAVRHLPETIAAPQDLRVTTSAEDLAGWIGLAWTPSADDGAEELAVSHYRVEVKEGTDGAWRFVADVPAGGSTAIVPRVIYGADYYFRVHAVSVSDPYRTEFAVRAVGDDPFELTRTFSETVETGPARRRYLPDRLAPPTGVVGTDAPADAGGNINVAWTASADDGAGELAVSRYQVQYRADDEEEWTDAGEVAGGSTSYVFSAAMPETTYVFRVRAATVGTRAGFVASDWVESEGVVSESEMFELDDDTWAPGGVEAADVTWDSGAHALVTWTAVDDIGTGTCRIDSYQIFARDGEGGFFTEVHSVSVEEINTVIGGEEVDGLEVDGDKITALVSGLDPHKTYVMKVVSHSPAGIWVSADSETISPAVNWFKGERIWVFILGAVICGFILFFIRVARKGGDLFVRKMAGLDAVDEAIGRATEMGRPILFVPGIMDLDNVQTLAGLTILGHTAKMVAEYDTRLDVPVSRSLVLTAGREVIKQAYLEAGRPDAYSEDMVHYITDAQFGYVAGVNGIIVRDEPATCFYMGAFYAESLILAETGNTAGAIQIAGTAMPSQLPFFVAACDYTLIGEELFAASAYLSQDPKQMGSLKGQDVGKAIAMVSILLGALAATFGIDVVLEFLRSVFS